MTKNVIKVVVVALVTALLIISLATSVSAEPMSFDDIGAAITVVQVVGVGVAIIMLIVLAIKYISAAPGDKADIKKHAVVYVVGAVVLFAASGILGIVKNFASNVTAD